MLKPRSIFSELVPPKQNREELDKKAHNQKSGPLNSFPEQKFHPYLR